MPATVTVSEIAISSEKNLKEKTLACQKKLLQESKKLIEVFDANQSGLGAHSAKIYQLLQSLVDDCKDEQKVKKLTHVLEKTSAKREQYRNDSPYVKK